jgi:hypothetical protein
MTIQILDDGPVFRWLLYFVQLSDHGPGLKTKLQKNWFSGVVGIQIFTVVSHKQEKYFNFIHFSS